MSSSAAWLVTLLAWTLAVPAAWRSRGVTQGTTLSTVVPWCAAAAAAWCGVSIAGAVSQWREAAWRDHLLYIASVLSLCPPIAVLGARRPTCRVWPLFVLFPLLAVLLWPVIAMGGATWWQRRLELETPQVVMFGLVLVMGYGNYAGTRLTGPAALAATMLFLIPASHSRWLSSTESHRDIVDAIAAGGVGLAVIWSSRVVRMREGQVHRFDGVWREFVTLFGLVWSRRLLDRLQLQSERQGWNCQVTPAGFCGSCTPDAQSEVQIEQALRWLLRRFVDPDWLDDRLGPAHRSDNPPSMSLDL